MFEDVSATSRAQAAIVAPLILDFLEWLLPRPQPYSEVMDTWRTSCPRLTVWEDAVDAGLVARRRTASAQSIVEVTDVGRRLLRASGRL